MKSSDKYNIDGLLRTKTFAELTNSEKAFVLESVGSQEAYSELRKVLLQAEKTLKSENLKAPAGLRADLMDAFDAHHAGNSKKVLTLWPSGKPWYRQNMVRFGIAAGLIGLIWFVYPVSETENKQLAERKEKPTEEPHATESFAEPDSSFIVNEEIVNTEEAVNAEQPVNEQIEVIEKPILQEADMIAEVKVEENLSLRDLQPLESSSADLDERMANDMEIAANSSSEGEIAESVMKQSADIQSYPESVRQAPAATRMQEQNLANRKKESAPPPFRLSDQQDWLKDHYTAW